MLGGFRVLELGDNAAYCGKIFVDLGAEVIKVERPGGDATRRQGPFFRDDPHPEHSLVWLSYNAGKKSITLDIESVAGQRIFRELVKSADFLIESFPPGYLSEIGLGYGSLSAINPRLVMISITPFGQAGPYKDYKGPDLVGMGMGGMMYITGESDRPPHRIGYPQAYLMAGCMAAIGSLVAHYHRETTGLGQYIDVSMQESVAWGAMNAPIYHELTGVTLKRAGPHRSGLSSALQRIAWPCKDGAVVLFIAGGKPFARGNRALVELMDQNGMADDFLKGIDWESFDQGTMTQELHDDIESRYVKFFMRYTRGELHKIGTDCGIRISPMMGPRDLIEYDQLKARELWQEVEHPDLNANITYPGPLFRSSPHGPQRITRAPHVGEHNEDIYVAELGLSKEDLGVLRETGAA